MSVLLDAGCLTIQNIVASTLYFETCEMFWGTNSQLYDKDKQKHVWVDMRNKVSKGKNQSYLSSQGAKYVKIYSTRLNLHISIFTKYPNKYH